MTNAALNAETCSMLAPAGVWWQEAKGIWKDQQEHWKRLSWTLAHPGMTMLMFPEGTNCSCLLLNLSDSWVWSQQLENWPLTRTPQLGVSFSSFLPRIGRFLLYSLIHITIHEQKTLTKIKGEEDRGPISLLPAHGLWY